jgi:hypothetical protein
MWLAPNLVTLIGFSWPLFNYVLVWSVAPGMGPGAGPWVHISCAVGLFFYQVRVS